jgi:hypothetical protein
MTNAQLSADLSNSLEDGRTLAVTQISSSCHFLVAAQLYSLSDLRQILEEIVAELGVDDTHRGLTLVPRKTVQ